MAGTTGIAWTDATFNPWIGCRKISPACKHCYAEVSTPARTLRHGGLEVWGPPATTERKRTSRANWLKPLAWNRTAERTGKRIKVFCASLADVFEDHPSLTAWRLELFALIEKTPLLDWQLLTKRPENMRAMLPPSWLKSPRENVWLGTTVEDQASADKRIPELLSTPAVVRFLSCEPLLSRVDLDPPLCQYCSDGGEVADGDPPWCVRCNSEAVFGHWLDACASATQSGINWVIVGGESGPGARPFDLDWARSIVEQCKWAGVAVFVKQLGLRAQGEWFRGDEPLPRTRLLYDARDRDPSKHRFMLEDLHGSDMNEWPADLRVRQFPKTGGAR